MAAPQQQQHQHQQQEEALLRAIVVSSSSHWSGQLILGPDRQQAFQVLQDFSNFAGRVPLVLEWLQRPQLVVAGNDCTVAGKLYACEILGECLKAGGAKQVAGAFPSYSHWTPEDRLRFRQAVLVAAHYQAQFPLVVSTTNASTTGGGTAILPLANKLSSLLAGLMVRDFPQRWTTCMDDLFSQLWSPPIQDGTVKVGNKMLLQVLQQVAEDCTDSDFNAKISTKRRNDILIGLNEVSNQFLPILYQALEQVATLTQARASIHQMRTYLLQHQQTVSMMTPEQLAAYQFEDLRIRGTSILVADTMRCLEKFCRSMPLEWIVNPEHDFSSAFFHLMREPSCGINVTAVDCLDQLAMRGKLTYEQWIQWIQDLPQAVQQANQQLGTREQEYLEVELTVTSSTGNVDPNSLPDPLTRQLDFHRALSRMLSTVLSSNMANIHQYKHLLQPPSNPNENNTSGNKAVMFANFLRLLVEMLHHPSGRVVGEQVNLWITMLKDPQISKATSKVLDPFLSDILSCNMVHMVKLDWDDILENDDYPNASLIQASWEDEDDYAAWVAEYRSKSSQLYKYIGNCRPLIASSLLQVRMEQLINQYGAGQPLDHLHPGNQQLTQASTAVREVEGFTHPMDNVLNGVPSWVFENTGGNGPNDRAAQVRASISELARLIVTWNPSYLWLKFRRVQLLECLRHVWKYDSSFLLEGVDSLLKTIGIADEWRGGKTGLDGARRLSDDVTSLRKRSSTALVAVSKVVPDKLVPWLTQLSEATRALLSTDDLLSTNRMHLYEFLSVVATAVDNPVDRANFIGNVLADAISTIQSSETQQALLSIDNFLAYLGIAQAATNPASVTDAANVKLVTDRFVRLFSAFNELLSVGRRCYEASKKRPSGGIPCPGGINTPIPKEVSTTEAAETMSFPDEGPISIRDLAVDDPFVPLWPSILPSLLQLVDILLKLWRPEEQAILLRNQVQRYALAISDDDAFLAKKTDGKNGGVFGEGGTAGSIIPGTDRRDQNLAPRWSSWFNELRNSLVQLLGLLAGQRILYAPEIAGLFPQVVAVVVNLDNLRGMENRQMAQYLKQFIEVLMLSCPPPLYATHLAPILDPVIKHMRFRLEKTWEPVLRPGSTEASCKPLFVDNCDEASTLAAQGTDVWYLSYYARSGLFVGSLDATTAEAAVEKYRFEITRVYGDLLQSALALKGPWALVLANIAKEEETSKGASKGPPGKLDLGGKVNADGTPRSVNQKNRDVRAIKRIAALDHFLFLENESIAGNVTLSIIQCLEYPDAYTCRRMNRICHRLLETVAWEPRYTELLGRRLLAVAVRNMITEPKWMVGVEWEVINVIRDVYCRLALGQCFQPGGQGAGQQMTTVTTTPQLVYEQAKTVDQPLQGGGVLTTPSNLPRDLLATLPGITVDMIRQLDQDLKEKRSAKDQKDCIKDFLLVAADQWKENDPNSRNSAPEDSLLHLNTQKVDVEDIPEKLVTVSQLEGGRKKKGTNDQSVAEVGMGAFNLFS